MVLKSTLLIKVIFIKDNLFKKIQNYFINPGGLVPLHNACSYGHFEVAELLVKHGANVNVADLWKFTPLHEAGLFILNLFIKIMLIAFF